ncbi:unnamed protein product [Prunus armeniaca]|uniref:Uncharacterized protein n=1 Tax=Prunus armeniaca TaxID=36596 RepID=A0A6J5XIW0_PRUAR|nr:unnamed protein product [Prunus armeniaca]
MGHLETQGVRDEGDQRDGKELDRRFREIKKERKNSHRGEISGKEQRSEERNNRRRKKWEGAKASSKSNAASVFK